ncbi:MAG: NAD(P)H-binding protein [Actinomycetota bacterium]|nr:NAD(P)H-binding protein [Actinomycetota bacterium]
MSILLIDPPEELGAAVVRQLLSEGDEVRVLSRERARTQYWKELGAHVAVGDPADDDLVERAALNVRTIVLLNWEEDFAAKTESVVRACKNSGVGRVVISARKVKARVVEDLERLDIDYVLLVLKRRLIGDAVEPEAVARAVSAADDLAGEPRLTIDLTDPRAWEALRLSVP